MSFCFDETEITSILHWLFRLSVKNIRTFQKKSLFSHPIVVIVFGGVCLNVKIRNLYEKILSEVYANAKVSRNVGLRTILAENQIFLKEVRWGEIYFKK